MKLTKILISALLIFSLSVVSVSANNLQTTDLNDASQTASRPVFSDVPSNYWAKSAIDKAVTKGYVNGYADGTFKPDKAVTRAEFIKMLIDALRFNDWSDPHEDAFNSEAKPWYAPYVNLAKDAKILRDDYTEKQFNNGLPRNEMAKLAVLSLGPLIRAWSNEYLPDGRYNIEAKSLGEYMFLALQSGLIQGLGNGKVGAKETTTRAQAITIIERILTFKNGGKLTPADKYTQSNAEFEWNRSNILTHFAPYIFNTRTVFGSQGFLLEDRNKNKYKAELLRFMVIDLEDKNDPFIKDVKNFKNLVWAYSMDDSYKPYRYKISDYPKSYLIVAKTKVHYNKWDNRKYVDLIFSGYQDFNAYEEQFYKGKLKGISRVFDPSDPTKGFNETHMWIIPKSAVESQKYATIRIDMIYADPKAGGEFADINLFDAFLIF